MLFSPRAFTCGTGEPDLVGLVKEYLDTFYNQLHVNMTEQNARRNPLGLILHMTARWVLYTLSICCATLLNLGQ